MASQSTVYAGAISAQAWATDKAMISTGSNSVTAQVILAGKPNENTDTIYSAPIVIPANNTRYMYIGVGNQLTIVGSNSTAAEVGTASSANSGVYNI
ncbi:MAG: hypothetical protein HOM20_12450 [Porticoccaceae bacterium]|jgi:hypothetical protein|nr:hypothetical protein [Porticoccaceae bacterium]